MKYVSVVFSTLAAVLIALIAGRYLTGFWLFFTFGSLQIHLAVVTAILAVFAFVMFRNWVNVLLTLAAIALGAHGYYMLGQFRQPGGLDYSGAPRFKLLSTNIMGDNSANGKRIADYIIGSGADVVFVQESAPIGPEIPRIKAVYPYRLGCGAQTITCDNSLWSKYPITDGKVITASPIYRDRLMIATISIDGHPVNFVNMHLTKPYFDNFHEVELGLIGHQLDKLQGPVVVAGDFNASILTRDVRWFLPRNRLMSAEKEPNTIPVEAPEIGLAIDHVFVRDPLRFISLARQPDALGSNHFGLIAEIVITDPTVTYPPR
jgi:endonuclease/exonuclease/phosphatase (EEP) superfamily protein YafD